MKKHLIPILSLALFVGWFFINEIAGILRYINVGLLIKYVGIYTVIATVIYYSFYFITKKTHKSWLYAQVMVFFLLLFGHSRDFISKHIPFFSKYGYFIPFWILLLGIALFLVYRLKINYPKFQKFIGIVLSVLTIYALFTAVQSKEKGNIIENQITATPTPSLHPNIYLFIFDEFSSLDKIEELGYSSTDFKEQLAARNFKIVPKSYSYTDLTSLCVPSVMNATSPNFSFINNPVSNQELYLIWNEYQKNGLGKYLKNQGYQTSLYGIMPMEDMPNTSGMKYQDFLMDDLLRQNTLIGRTNMQIGDKIAQSNIPVISSIYQNIQGDYDKKIYDNDINNLKLIKQALAAPKEAKPEFLVGHFLFPHAPYNKDLNGQFIDFGTSLSDEDQYIEQVKFTQSSILELTDLVLQKDSLAVVILMGDHGYRASKDSSFSVEPFLAFYDAQGTIQYNDSTTSVNLMRAILNDRFGFNFSPLKDSVRLVYLNRTMH